MTGCWTCRVRKKKCNQASPSCSECQRLGIRCDGYGKRPAWADGGILEAKYKRELKDHIRRKAKHRRNDSFPQVFELTPPLTDFGDTDADVDTNASTNGAHVFDNQFVDFFISSPVLMAQYDSTAMETTAFQPSSACSSPRSSNPVSPSNIAFDEDLSMSELLGHDLDGSSTLKQLEHHTSSSSKRDINLSQCEALLYYLDNLFWAQFPACKMAPLAGDRTWILHHMLTSPVFKKALMRLRATAAERKIDCIKTKPGHIHDKLDNLHDLQEQSALSAVKLASRTQTDVQTLLAAASMLTYRSVILGSSSSLNEILSTTRDLVDQLNQQQFQGANATSQQAGSLKFSLSQAIYVDTLHAATQRSAYILDDFQLLKSDLTAHSEPERLYGCPLWMLQAIRNIIQLDRWKRELSAQGMLSVPELVSRGAKLLELLAPSTTSRRSSTMSNTTTSSDENSKSSAASSFRLDFPFSHASKGIVTQLYINAASIYIHVIVSGANPQLSEIQNLVGSSLSLLHSLRTFDIFACVVWPLMIIMSMAAGDRRESCRFIITRATEQEQLHRVFTLMLDVVQECWRLANEAPFLQWDWSVAMQNLGISSPAFILPV